MSSSELPDRTPVLTTDVAELRLSDARARYEELERIDSRRAKEFALAVAPIFASHQFFYRRLISEDTDADIRRRAAASALNAARSGVEMDYKILIRSIKILEEMPAGEQGLPSLRDVVREGAAGGKLGALAEIYGARLERRWGDAYRMLARYVEEHPRDNRKRLELGLLAYRSGLWGERASSLVALRDYPRDERARQAFAAVDSFFRACAVSLTSPADAHRRASLQSPASVFRHVLKSCPPAAAGERKGIVMISPSLAGGGAERIAATICGDLSARRERVELAIYEAGGRSGRDPLFYLPMTGVARKDVRVLDLGAPLREPFRWLPPNLSRKAQAIHDFLAVRRPRTLYLTLDMANLAGGFAGLVAGVPNIILHCHNQPPTDLYAGLGMEGWAPAYRALLERREVRMIAVSETVAKGYAGWAGVRSDRIGVVRNGLDLRQLMRPDKPFLGTFRSALGIPPASRVVGSAFRFEEVKRPDLWLRMARRVAETRPDVHFVLFGEGARLDAARLGCRDLGLEDRVHFMGHVDDLYRRLPLLDVFVLSSRSEGLPNVLLEAQAAGAVPVAFDVGGCHEAMIDGVTGRLVREQSHDALAGAVLRVLDDPQWRRAARREGRRLVRSQFSVNRMLEAFDRLLTDR